MLQINIPAFLFLKYNKLWLRTYHTIIHLILFIQDHQLCSQTLRMTTRIHMMTHQPTYKPTVLMTHRPPIQVLWCCLVFDRFLNVYWEPCKRLLNSRKLDKRSKAAFYKIFERLDSNETVLYLLMYNLEYFCAYVWFLHISNSQKILHCLLTVKIFL